MFFDQVGPQKLYRRDWGADAAEPLRKLDVALDAITPSQNDASMRIIFCENGGYTVSIAFYANIYFSGPIKKIHHVTLSNEVFDELLGKGYILPFAMFTAPNELSRLWVVSDEGEIALTALFKN